MKRRHRRWRPQMTREETFRGWIFFALYLTVFPFAMAGVRWVLEPVWPFSDAASNAIYYFLAAAAVFAVFWGFLQKALDILADRLPENLTALVSGLLGSLALGAAVRLIPLPVEDPLFTDWPEQFTYSPWATVAVVLLLMPIVEEVLFRGLLFGSLRRHSRRVAWGASVVLYMVYCVWGYAFSSGDWNYLALGLRYLPMAVGLTWCYDRGGSVWSAVLLHAALNAVTLFTAV